MRNSIFLALAATVSAAAPASAGIVDASFETQGAGTGTGYCYLGSYCPEGAWIGNGAGLQHESNGGWPGISTPAGSYYGFVQGTGALGQIFTADSTGSFTLNWLEGARGNYSPTIGGNQSYSLQIAAMSDLHNASTIFSGSTYTGQAFAERASSSFSLVAGEQYVFAFIGSAHSDDTAFIDDVQLAAAVPEPASWAMMITGFGLIGSAVRRRRATIAFA